MVVVETHPEDAVDLRLDAPWPELQKLASTLNLEEMDSFEHGHVPYILILLKLLEQWKETVNNLLSLPTNGAFPILPFPVHTFICSKLCLQCGSMDHYRL